MSHCSNSRTGGWTIVVTYFAPLRVEIKISKLISVYLRPVHTHVFETRVMSLHLKAISGPKRRTKIACLDDPQASKVSKIFMIRLGEVSIPRGSLQ